MFRSFRQQDFIQLPVLSEAGTLTLVDELQAAANVAPKLPYAVTAALGLVVEKCELLKKSIAARERAGSSADPKARAADRALDDAWAALQTWLLGWTQLPETAHPRIREAKALYRILFPKGLQFLTLEFTDEWTESQKRLSQIQEERLDALLEELGGRPFLDVVSQCHDVYGNVLHITGKGAPEPDALVREALDATHMALREYVAQIAATVRRNEAESVETAAHLLEPLSVRSNGLDEAEAEVTLLSNKRSLGI